MRVLLIQPPPKGGITSRYLVHEPMNLLTLGTVVRDKAGAKVKILDFQVTPYSDENLFALVNKYRPDIVGLTAMTSQVKGAGRIAKKIKDDFPDTLTVIGGQHPSALPKRTMEEFPALDVVIVGEGEKSFENLAENEPLEKIEGIYYRKGDKIISTGPAGLNENLDDIPICDRDLVDRRLYQKGPVVLGVDRSFFIPVTVNLSRGCPYNCSFCSASIIYGNKVRFRSIDNIRLELELCKEKYNTNHISINDSLFSHNKDFALSVGELLARLKMTWDCRARADQMDRSFAMKIKKLGCVKVFMGAESGSQRILDL